MTDDTLEKAVWTHGDFDMMGWHDATVHAIAFHEDDEDASYSSTSTTSSAGSTRSRPRSTSPSSSHPRL
jgi:hypothetical protein